MSNEEIIEAIRAGGDQRKLLGELYEQNRSLISVWARKWQSRAEYEDLMQEAFLALVAAVNAFDESQGYKFITYYGKTVTRHFMRVFSGGVHLPEWLKEDIASYRIHCRLYEIENGSQPDERTSAFSLNWKIGRVRIVKQWAEIIAVSLDAPNRDGLTLGDMIPDTRDNIAALVEDVGAEKVKENIWSVVNELPEEQANIILKRYRDSKTRDELKAETGMSAAQLANIEAKAIGNLRRSEHRHKLNEAAEYYGYNLYSGTGLSTFERTGESSVEHAVLLKEITRFAEK